MNEQTKEACFDIINEKKKYIEMINQADELFPINVCSHFICGIPNSEMIDDVKIESFELLDINQPIPMLFRAFGQGYFHIEDHHFTDDFKSALKNDNILKNNLMYMIYNMRDIREPNVCYSFASEHEKYRQYDMDLDEIFDEEKLDEYMTKIQNNNIEYTRYHLPVIKGFKLSVDTKYNAIICEIILLE
jgi:hypothetical protein